MKPKDYPDSSEKSFLKGRIDSFGNAINGIKLIIGGEKNFRIHLVVLAAVIAAGIFFRLTTVEWLAIILVSGLVLVSECINTAIEHLGDAVSEQQNINLKKAKDTSAAGVLLAAIISVVVGLVIFVPALFRLFR